MMCHKECGCVCVRVCVCMCVCVRGGQRRDTLNIETQRERGRAREWCTCILYLLVFFLENRERERDAFLIDVPLFVLHQLYVEIKELQELRWKRKGEGMGRKITKREDWIHYEGERKTETCRERERDTCVHVSTIPVSWWVTWHWNENHSLFPPPCMILTCVCIVHTWLASLPYLYW